MYKFWFVFALIVLGASYIPGLGAFDCLVHDTYYVVATFYLCPLIFSFALVYWLLHKFKVKLNDWFSIAHFVFTSIAYLLLFFYIATSTQDSSFSHSTFENVSNYGVLFFLVGQLLFILHILTLFVQFLRKTITHTI